MRKRAVSMLFSRLRAVMRFHSARQRLRLSTEGSFSDLSRVARALSIFLIAISEHIF